MKFNPLAYSRLIIRQVLASILFIFFITVCGWQSTHAQVSQKKLKSTADAFFEEKDYRQALNYYFRYNEYKGGDSHVMKRMAICQFHTNQIEKAETSIQQLQATGDLSDDAEALYYLGEIAMHQNNFLQAAAYFKNSLQHAGNDELRNVLLHKLKNCEAGLDILHFPRIGFIENFGPLVNSIEDDIMPLFSKNHVDLIYFASNFDRIEANPLNAKKSFDIYSTSLDEGNWLNPTLFPKKFSSDRDEFPLDFFDSGQVMYFQRGSVGGATIFIDTFSNEEANIISKSFASSNAPIFPELGDFNVHNYSDSILIFSSERPGGSGGQDLYYTIQRRNGWSKPENLGNTINSKFDEVDAFLSDNGATLYFSSNRPSAMGGYDIFYSRFNATTKEWEAPRNMGLPINSAGEDRGIQIASNGQSLIFSSNRKTGYGGFDLYIVYPEQAIGEMTMTRGQVLPAFLKVQENKLNDVTAFLEETENENPVESTAEESETTREIEVDKPDIQLPITPETVIEIAPIYYSASDVVLNPQSTQELDKIARLVIKHPHLRINLLSHSAGYDGPAYFDLYFSVRRAEQIVNYLIERGVTENSISILGVGDQYPYAKRIINGEVAGFSTKLNRRIDVVIENGIQYSLGFDNNYGGLGQAYIDSRHVDLNKNLGGISFKAQVKKANQVFKDDVLDNYEHAMIEKLADENSYYYSVGWSPSYDVMKQLANRLRSEGYAQTKVIAYLNGERLTKLQMADLSEKSAELKQYLADQ